MLGTAEEIFVLDNAFALIEGQPQKFVLPAEIRNSKGGCDLSRRCSRRNSPADRRSVTETTMRTVEVVMLQPGGKMLIAFL